MSNLKLALRLLLKNPFVTIVAVLSLALGIGANAGIFSLVDQLLLRPMAVRNPDELVNLGNPGPKPGSQMCGQAGECDVVFSYPMFRDLGARQQVFTGIAAHVGFGANLGARDQTISGQGLLVSGSYFPLLGIRPALGRLIGPDDDVAPGQSRVVVLSHEYWRTSFGADPAVVNQTMVINGESFTIVGVAQEGFSSTTVGLRPQVFVPVTARAIVQPTFHGFENRREYFLYLFARLKPGVSLAQAHASVNVLYRGILNDVEASLQQGMSEQTLAKFRAKELTVVPGARGQSSVGREARTPLSLLFGVTVLVLLIACANIINLLLARGAARSSEMAVRLSIGGTRGRLVRQLMVESLMLGLLGGAAGLLVARTTLGAMAAILPAVASQTFSVHLDGRVIMFTAVVAITTTLLFGLFPALYATRPSLISALREQGGQPSGGRLASRWRTGLATAQVALAMALLGSAGLFAKSLRNISQVDLGVQVEHVLTFGISPSLNGYDSIRSQLFYQRLTEELHRLPGVTQVSAAMVPLLGGSNWGNDVHVEGYDRGPDVDNNSRFNEVGPAYFATVGEPVLLGREFNETDVLGAPKVAIINQTFAKKFKLGANPVGRRMDMGNDSLDVAIVGMVKDAKYSDVKDEVPPLFFVPYRQDAQAGSLNFLVRTSQDPAKLLASVPRVVARLDKNLPVEDLRTMPEQIRQNIFLDRFISIFTLAFALLATTLAAVGLYGVLAYTVTQRTREIGVRMALGAEPTRVRLMVLRQVGRMMLVGGVIGIAAAIGLGRLAGSLLYQMSGWDPVVLLVSACLLSLVAAAAGLIPANRAARLDPVRALRYE